MPSWIHRFVPACGMAALLALSVAPVAPMLRARTDVRAAVRDLRRDHIQRQVYRDVQQARLRHQIRDDVRIRLRDTARIRLRDVELRNRIRDRIRVQIRYRNYGPGELTL